MIYSLDTPANACSSASTQATWKCTGEAQEGAETCRGKMTGQSTDGLAMRERQAGGGTPDGSGRYRNKGRS
jgi:hypothetical protein